MRKGLIAASLLLCLSLSSVPVFGNDGDDVALDLMLAQDESAMDVSDEVIVDDSDDTDIYEPDEDSDSSGD